MRMRTLERREAFLGVCTPGGVRLKGFVGLHRSTDGQLLFTAIIHVSAYGTTDPIISGKGLRWTEMSLLPDALGQRIMEQADIIEKLIGERGFRNSIQDFLAPLAGRLFTAHMRLLGIVHRKRCRPMTSQLAPVIRFPTAARTA